MELLDTPDPLDPFIHPLTLERVAPCPIEPQAVRRRRGTLEAVRIWPRPAFWRHRDPRGWRPARSKLHVRWARDDPDADPIWGPDVLGWTVPLRPLFAQIPEEVRAALEPLPHSNCWEVLQLVDKVPELIEVVGEIPVLALMLTDDRRLSVSRLRDLATQRRLELLRFVGLRPERWVLKALGKMDPSAVKVVGGPAIRRTLNGAAGRVRKLLMHLPRIEPDVLAMLANPELLELCTFGLLAEPADGRHLLLRPYLDDIRQAREAGNAPARPARFSSRAQVEQFHHDLRNSSSQTWLPAAFGAFDPPTGPVVLDGDPELSLEPVLDAAGMLQLGIQEQLCIPEVRRYPRRAAEGVGAMYAVGWRDGEGPRTATLWLERRRVGCRWFPAEFRGRANAAVPSWAHDRVTAWLRGVARASMVAAAGLERGLGGAYAAPP